jgi:tRNA threonylcarbamoyl adenosine modification protein YjeE
MYPIEVVEEQARLLAASINSPASIFLWGEVGAGKTVFARAFIRAYYGNEEMYVVSPSFTILQNYYGAEDSEIREKMDILHFDFYRIKEATELVELGIDEAVGKKICIIEWPERLGLFPKQTGATASHHNSDASSLLIKGRTIINVYIKVVNGKLRDLSIQRTNI